MKKNFFYRIEPGMILSEIIAMDINKRGEWITQVAIDLQNSNAEESKTTFARQLIEESDGFRNKRRESGKLGGLAKASTAKAKRSTATLKASTALAKASLPLPSSSSSSSIKNKPFEPPTIEKVKAYCLERGNGVDPERWHDFYESKGWMIGKNKMKSWKAAVRTWEKPEDKSTGTDYGQY